MDDRAPSHSSERDSSTDAPVESAASATPGGASPPLPPQNQDSILWGMTAAVGAFLMLSTMSLLAKLLSAQHTVMEVAFWRNIIGVLPLAVAVLLFRRREILAIKSKPGVVLTR